MKKMLIIAILGAVGLTGTSKPADCQGNACEAQCKASYRQCARESTNPGGLNQCRKALESCLATCE